MKKGLTPMIAASWVAITLFVVAAAGAGCSSTSAGGIDANLGASYGCWSPGVPTSLICVVGQSVCQIDHGHGGASGSGGDTTTWASCRNLPEACATTPTCNCICSRINCTVVAAPPESPTPGCTCTNTRDGAQLTCFGV